MSDGVSRLEFSSLGVRRQPRRRDPLSTACACVQPPPIPQQAQGAISSCDHRGRPQGSGQAALWTSLKELPVRLAPSSDCGGHGGQGVIGVAGGGGVRMARLAPGRGSLLKGVTLRAAKCSVMDTLREAQEKLVTNVHPATLFLVGRPKCSGMVLCPTARPQPFFKNAFWR